MPAILPGRETVEWPLEWRDATEKLWREGYSASQIAAHLDAAFNAGLTRNAVIGKLHRMGLTREDRRGRKPKAHWKTPRRTPCKSAIRFGKGETVAKPSWTPKDIKPDAPKPPIPAVHVSAITGAIIPGPGAIPPAPLPITPPIAPDAKPITLMDITSNTCCWPINDGNPWLFCGDSRDPRSGKHDRGYCTRHHRWSRSSETRGRKRADVCVGVE